MRAICSISSAQVTKFLSGCMKSQGVAIKVKATEQCFPVLLLRIILNQVGKVIDCPHSEFQGLN